MIASDSDSRPANLQPCGTHAAGLTVRDDGTVFVNWYGGTCRGEDENGACTSDPLGHSSIYVATLDPQSDVFSRPAILTDAGKSRLLDANLLMHDHRLWAFYVRDGMFDDHIVYRTADGAHVDTWSNERAITGVRGRCMNPPLAVGKRLLVPVSAFDKSGSWRDALIVESSDGGDSWQDPVRLLTGELLLALREPCLVPINSQEIHVYTRVSVFAHPWEPADVTDPRWKAHRAVSQDGGRTWSRPEPTNVPNFDSKLNVVQLPDGRLLMAFNPTTRRFPLALATSSDGGLTWLPAGVLDPGPGEMSYPTMQVTAEGRLHVVYSWRRREIMYREYELV